MERGRRPKAGRGEASSGSIGGPAAILAHDNIKAVRQLDFEDLGMEAVWEIDVKDFPAFIVVDDKGNDFFSSLI